MTSPLNGEELLYLESLLPYATAQELAEIEQLLEPTGQQATPGRLTLTPRQRDFKILDCEEALFGGAAGGGKSEALLDWLAEGIETPGYSGLIFRRTYPQLSKADGLIPKSFRMYKPMGGVWQATEKRWTFPSGATIELGHLHLETSIYDYQGPSYHRIAFDELTQFSERQYTYLFSRLRRTKGFPIRPGMRAGSNPGGEGHAWVRKRFVTKEAIEFLTALGPDGPSPPGCVFYATKDRAFVPARIADNPYLDKDDYDSKLAHLDPVTRARLKSGDWSVTEDARVKSEWLRYWSMQGDYYRLWRPDGTQLKVILQTEAERPMIVDCAGSSDDVKRERQGKPSSLSVISTFDYFREDGYTVWRHADAHRWEFPELCQAIERGFEQWKPAWIGIEDEKTGRAVAQSLRHLPVRLLPHEGKDKLTRAGTWLNDLAAGKFFVPNDAPPWLERALDELLVWDGHPDTPFDHGDTCAYAAKHVRRVLTGQTTVLKRGFMTRAV